jgi:hypothetical protein
VALPLANIAGSDFTVNTELVNSVDPAVGKLSNGGFVVAWSADVVGGTRVVLGQLYSASGLLVGPSFQVNTASIGCDFPKVAALPSGGFVIAWHHLTTPYSVWCQRYSSAGLAVGGNFQVNTESVRSQSPSVAALTGGGFVVTWFAFPSPYRCWLRRYDSAGAAVDSIYQTNTGTDSCSFPFVAALTGGGFVVTWSYGAAVPTIQGQLYSSTATSVGSNFQVSTTAVYSDETSVAALADGGFVVTWHANFIPYSVWGQLFFPNGSVLGSNFRVNSADEVSFYPSVAALGAIGFVVTWRTSPSPKLILGQLYSATGSALGTSFPISNSTIDASSPAVVALTGNTFVVLWNTEPSPARIVGQVWNVDVWPTSQLSGMLQVANRDGNNFKISTTVTRASLPSVALLSDGGFVAMWVVFPNPAVWGQRYTAAGVLVGPNFQVNTVPQGGYPHVTALSAGGFVVAWESSATPQRIRGQLYNSTGSKVGSNFLVSVSAGDMSAPSVAGLTGGGFVITWFCEVSPNVVWGQLYGAEGGAIDSNFQVNEDGVTSASQPSVAALVNGGFVVTWTAMYSPYSVWGQLYSAVGDKIGTNFQINTAAVATNFPAVAVQIGGEFVVTWEASTSPSSIWGQRYSASGTTIGNNFRISLAQVTSSLSSVASLDTGGFVVTWQANNSPYGVWGQLYAADGSVNSANFKVDVEVADSRLPSVVGLNGGKFVVVWFASTGPDSVWGQILSVDDVPTSQPSCQPTDHPSSQPSSVPSCEPTAVPTKQPSAQPSRQPSSKPTLQPSWQPSSQPTVQPSAQPSSQPTAVPSLQPNSQPTVQPSRQPSRQPTAVPSMQPSSQPTVQPSRQPYSYPSAVPSVQPSSQPTTVPSVQPSSQPTAQPTGQPSCQPTAVPSINPSCQPTVVPSLQPSCQPTAVPSSQPSCQPTAVPSINPSCQPTAVPSLPPSCQPTAVPSLQPSCQPTAVPSLPPSCQPTAVPSVQPSCQPTAVPSSRSTTQPSSQPSKQPTSQPSLQPSSQPSKQPISQPSLQPSSQPSKQPISQPSLQPSSQPSAQPTSQPSRQPFSLPTGQPTLRPTFVPSFSQAPTIQTSRNWTAQIAETSLIFGLVVLKAKTIVCGGVSSSICLQFENPSGMLSAVYGLPWDQTVGVAAVASDESSFIVAGVWTASQQHVIARLRISPRQMVWAFKTLPSQAQFKAVIVSAETQHVIAVGYDSSQTVVVACLDKDSGVLLWGYSYQIEGLKTYIIDVVSLSQLRGSCVAGHVIDISNNYKTSLFLLWVSVDGSFSAASVFFDVGGNSRASSVAVEPTSGDAIVAGYAYTPTSEATNALLARVHNEYSTGSVIWAITIRNIIGTESQFIDVIVSGASLFAVGYSTGFSSFTQKDMIVVQMDLANGNPIKGVRISGPSHTLCSSLVQVNNGIRIACRPEGKAMLFYLDKDTLISGDLPPGYTWHEDVLSLLFFSTKSLVVSNILSSQQSVSKTALAQTAVTITPWSASGALQPLNNLVVSSPSFTQSWPKNLQTPRPTAAPTVFSGSPQHTSTSPSRRPTVCPSAVPSEQPSSAPSSLPSSRPTSSPTVSAHPTGQPSTSGPTATYKPIHDPSKAPTFRPSKYPTVTPTTVPSQVPTPAPSIQPSPGPSRLPTVVATEKMSLQPSPAPTTDAPTSFPPTPRPSIVTSNTPTSTTASSLQPTLRPSAAATTSADTIAPTVLTTSSNASSTSAQEAMSRKDILWSSICGSALMLIAAYVVYKLYGERIVKFVSIKRKVAPNSDIENAFNVQNSPEECPTKLVRSGVLISFESRSNDNSNADDVDSVSSPLCHVTSSDCDSLDENSFSDIPFDIDSDCISLSEEDFDVKLDFDHSSETGSSKESDP